MKQVKKLPRPGIRVKARNWLRGIGKQKPKIEFKFDPSFYTSGRGPATSRGLAKTAVIRALDRLGLDSKNQAQMRMRNAVEELMERRIAHSLTLPRTMKQLKKLERQIGGIDVEITELITKTLGPEKAKSFSLLLAHFSKIKPLPKTKKRE